MNKRVEWNLKCDPNDFFISFNGITFYSWKESPYNLITQEHWRLIIFFCTLTFFSPPCLKSEHRVSFFIFGLGGHKKVFWILSSSLIITVGTFDINERNTIFEIVKVLKTMILPSSVRQFIGQTFKTFWILVMLSRNFFSFRFSLLYEKWIPIIFILSLHKSIHSMPQTVTFTLFSTQMPAISHFSWFGFKPEYFKNVANVLASSLMDLLSLKKKVVSSA